MTSNKQVIVDKELDLTSGKKMFPVVSNGKTDYMGEVVVYLVKVGIQNARCQLFRTNIEKFGGHIKELLTEEVTHIVVDDSVTPDRFCKVSKLGTPPSGVKIVKSSWLSACFREKKLVDFAPYQLDMQKCEHVKHETKELDQPEVNRDQCHDMTLNDNDDRSNKSSATTSRAQIMTVGTVWNAVKRKRDVETDTDSDYVPSDEDTSAISSDFTSGFVSTSDASPNTSPEKKLPVGKWICAQSSKAPKSNLNEHITLKLEEMVKNYESTNDKWRVFGYQKAIAALRKHPKEISTWEEAKSLPGVGERLADKIWEIAQSGELRKLNEFKSSEQVQVLKLFTDVWGAGPHTALAWYQQGFRTLEDLRNKASLNHQQKVGVRIYDDLLNRMPREEAAEIEEMVRKTAESLQLGIIAQACGSYRRGKATCGDVDILLTHPERPFEKGFFSKLIHQLKEIGFLTDDLVSVEENGNQKKYLGVCKLPGDNRKHRRLDIILVPYEEYACALVYFTGSAHFNRSLRHLCKKMNLSLNEHALKTGVVRRGAEKIYAGTVIPTPTEESIFKILGVPYRSPEERDH